MYLKRSESMLRVGASLAFLLPSLAVSAIAGEGNADRGWPSYNNDLLGQRFSPLNQIDKKNVANLQKVCTAKIQEGGSFQTSPIVVSGVMYVTTARDTIALDPVTCAERWRHTFVSVDEDVFPNNRGVAYSNGRLFRGTATGSFYALDAATGRILWSNQIGNPEIGEFVSAAPVASSGLVYIAIAGGDWGIRGRVLAFDQETGREVWRFNTIPTGEEFGADTWKNEKSALTGGGGVWSTMSLDVSTGELLVPVGNPAPDLNAEYRPGDNLFTNAIVSLDARTGKLLWYHQHKKNDSLDHDISSAPTIFRDPDVRDIIAYAGKDGQLTALDRQTKAKIYSTPVTTVDNITAVTSDAGIHVCPGFGGGVEWNGLAYDRKLNTLFAGAVDWCSFFKKGPAKYIQGEFFFGGEFTMDKEAAGWVTAVNASTGAVKWKYRTEKPVVSGISPTAGGIVFAGDTSGKFFAFDSESGKPLFTYATPGMIAGGIVTYSVKGKQYVAFTSGNVSRMTFGELGDPSIIVMSLPN